MSGLLVEEQRSNSFTAVSCTRDRRRERCAGAPPRGAAVQEPSFTDLDTPPCSNMAMPPFSCGDDSARRPGQRQAGGVCLYDEGAPAGELAAERQRRALQVVDRVRCFIAPTLGDVTTGSTALWRTLANWLRSGACCPRSRRSIDGTRRNAADACGGSPARRP